MNRLNICRFTEICREHDTFEVDCHEELKLKKVPLSPTRL